MAVNVTIVPGQTDPVGLEAMETLTARIGLTIIVKLFEVAGLPVAHVALEVSTQVITSPFTNAAFEYVVELLPTLLPFSFH